VLYIANESKIFLIAAKDNMGKGEKIRLSLDMVRPANI
jgi:hypothetical protein